MKITRFRKKYSFLSNFYHTTFIYDDHIYSTAEHAYQAQKAVLIKDRYWIELSATPGIAKRRGNRIPIQPNWDDIKITIMKDILWAKFSQNPKLGAWLLDTENTELIEGNNWHDNEWGDCICPVCQNIEGQNHLGKLLMEVRDQLK